MRIVGIDPGLEITGYAVLEVGGPSREIIDAGVIRTNRRKPLPERLAALAQDIEALLAEHAPSLMAVEELYSHYRFPRTGILMGHARGVILRAAAAAGMKVASYSATRVKKSLTGNGHATKQQVQRAVKGEFGLSELPKPPDVADALAIANCCANELAKSTKAGMMVKR